MFYILSKLIGILVSPLIWILIGILISGILTIKKSKYAIKSLIATILIATIFTNPFVANTAFHHWEKGMKKHAIDTTQKYDIAVVLSGMVAYGENPKQSNFGQSVDRILEATRLYHAGIVSKILITGGNASIQYDQPPESEILQQFLTQMAVPDSAIIMEKQSRNTHENALYTAKLLRKLDMQSQTILLITSAYHMRRSIACFDKQHIKVTPAPVDFYAPTVKTDIANTLTPSLTALNQWDILLHEWIGILYYKLLGYM
jgi:uncharacterized SAM-binding protein YcdF (DUF218 family)